MSLDRLINILVTVTLVEMMVLIGLRVTFAELINTAKSRALIARAAAANYLLVPVLALVLLILFAANPMVAAGFLVLAVCPGAPYGPPFAGIARANVPSVAKGEVNRIDAFGMMSALLVTQLLPLLLGLLLRHQRPELADRLVGPFELVSKLLNLSAAGLILATQFQMLAQSRMRDFVGMLILLAGSLVIGWLAGGPATANRRTMALTTALRNVGVGLVIVTGNFAGTPAVSAALSYGIVEVLLCLLVALWWRRSTQRAQPARL
jgi:BASS family bile acid:Na+ symporter